MTKPRSKRKRPKRRKTVRRKEKPVNLMPLIRILSGIPRPYLTIDEFLLLAERQKRIGPLTRSYIHLCLKRSQVPPP